MKARADPRLKMIPQEFWDELLDRFLKVEKLKLEADVLKKHQVSIQGRKTKCEQKIKEDLVSLVKEYYSKAAIKDNFNLFKQRYRLDLKFKTAIKYFDPEPIFKEIVEELKTGGFNSKLCRFNRNPAISLNLTI